MNQVDRDQDEKRPSAASFRFTNLNPSFILADTPIYPGNRFPARLRIQYIRNNNGRHVLETSHIGYSETMVMLVIDREVGVEAQSTPRETSTRSFVGEWGGFCGSPDQ